MAEAAIACGHDVVVVSGPVDVTYPFDARVVHVVSTEEMLEAAAGELRIDALEATALEEESGVGILDGEGVAERTVAGPELALEVGGPGRIGRIHGIGRRPGMGATAARLSGGDEVVLDAEAMDGVDGRWGVELVAKNALDLMPELYMLSSESSAAVAIAPHR